ALPISLGKRRRHQGLYRSRRAAFAQAVQERAPSSVHRRESGKIRGLAFYLSRPLPPHVYRSSTELPVPTSRREWRHECFPRKSRLLPVPHVAPPKTSAMPTQRSPLLPKGVQQCSRKS